MGLHILSWFTLAILFRLRRGLVPAGMLYWLVAALPLFVGAGGIWAWFRYLREADELQRRIQSNALAFGFCVTYFWIISDTVLMAAGAPSPEAGRHMAPGRFAYWLAVLYGTWQYR
jgi:hypothetical protein